MNETGTLSQRAYADSRRRRGLPGGTLRGVQKAVAAGRITVDQAGRIRPAVADRQWLANTDATRRPHGNGNGNWHSRLGISLPEAKTLESVERRRALKFENDLRAGQLVEVDAVERRWTTITVTVRDRILSVPSRLRLPLPHLTDNDLRTIDAELRRALEELADGNRREDT